MATKEVAGQTIDKKRRANTRGIDHLSLRPMIAEIERFGKWWVKNSAVDDYTQPVVYTIQTRGRRENKLGHFQPAFDWEAGEDSQRYGWSTKEGLAAHEINIVPEAMLRDPYEVLTTVAHEVEHMYNWNARVKDCAKSGRHNEEFKNACEEHNLVVEKAEKIGWTTVGFTDEMRKRIEDEFKPDYEAFSVFKEALPPPKPVRKSTVAFHVPDRKDVPVIRLAKGKAADVQGHLTWTIGDETVEFEVKPE